MGLSDRDPDGGSNVTTVKANEELDPVPVPALTAGGVVFSHARTDTTTTGQGLMLEKEVRTVAGACPADAAESLANPDPFTGSNTAEPGAALEYRITYRNDTADPLTDLVIGDVVPSDTQFVNAFCLDTPTVGFSGCAVTSSNPTHGPSLTCVGDVGARRRPFKLH